MQPVLAVILLPAVFALSIRSTHLDQKWELWKTKYSKEYKSVGQEALRRTAWEATYEKVRNHNRLADQGRKNFRLEMNHFADMTAEERSSKRCVLPLSSPRKHMEVRKHRTNIDIPAEVDWRKENCVTPVKNQGICGSCWAFATVAVLESRYCIKHKQLFNMSEQQLVDCDGKDQACCGGLPRNAFGYVTENGIMKSEDYVYLNYAQLCAYDAKQTIDLKVSKFYILPGESNMAASVAFDGPLSAAFGVTDEFQLFDGKGVYDGDCAASINHAITIVGYGTEGDKDYWIIKNSWDTAWADGGYAKVLRNANHCQIAEEVATADVTGPDEE